MLKEEDLKNSYCANFSYSEWWRYIGPVKPRQPLFMEGANLSESSNNKGI